MLHGKRLAAQRPGTIRWMPVAITRTTKGFQSASPFSRQAVADTSAPNVTTSTSASNAKQVTGVVTTISLWQQGVRQRRPKQARRRVQAGGRAQGVRDAVAVIPGEGAQVVEAEDGSRCDPTPTPARGPVQAWAGLVHLVRPPVAICLSQIRLGTPAAMRAV